MLGTIRKGPMQAAAEVSWTWTGRKIGWDWTRWAGGEEMSIRGVLADRREKVSWNGHVKEKLSLAERVFLKRSWHLGGHAIRNQLSHWKSKWFGLDSTGHRKSLDIFRQKSGRGKLSLKKSNVALITNMDAKTPAKPIHQPWGLGEDAGHGNGERKNEWPTLAQKTWQNSGSCLASSQEIPYG